MTGGKRDAAEITRNTKTLRPVRVGAAQLHTHATGVSYLIAAALLIISHYRSFTRYLHPYSTQYIYCVRVALRTISQSHTPGILFPSLCEIALAYSTPASYLV